MDSKFKILLTQALKFVGFSGAGWLLDFCTYAVLGHVSDNLFICNYISSFVGVTFVFIFSTRYVFSKSGNIPLYLKYIIYVVYELVLVFMASRLIEVINLFITLNFSNAFILSVSYLLSKILVTPFTLVLNFFVMKKLIEKL